MKSLSSYLIFPQKVSSKRNWRSDFIDAFVDGINRERKDGFYWKDGKKFLLKPVSAQVVAIRTAHLKTGQDLHCLLSICKDSKNRGGSFSKTFFGSIKTVESFKYSSVDK